MKKKIKKMADKMKRNMQDITKTKQILMAMAVVLLLSLLFLPVSYGAANVAAQAQSQQQAAGDQNAHDEAEGYTKVSDLADIVPAAAELSSRLRILGNMIGSEPDVSSIEKKCVALKTDVNDLAFNLGRLKDSHDTRYSDLSDLKNDVEQKIIALEAISKPLDNAIRQLNLQRKNWLLEQENWKKWQSSMVQTKQLDQLQTTFEEANGNIATALDQIFGQLEVLLILQTKVGQIQADLDFFLVQLEGQIADKQRSIFDDTSAPMFSVRYFSQFTPDLWISLQTGIDEISWPDRQFFSEHGWIILINVLLPLVMAFAIYRNRRTLNSLENWRFLAARPFSAGLFFFCVPVILFYQYEKFPFIWEQANVIIAGISFVRLSGAIIQVSWRKQFAYGLTIIFIATQLLDQLNFPIPLFRFYTVIISMIGLFFCRLWISQGRRQKESGLYLWLFRLTFVFLAVIIITEFWGKTSLAYYLFVSLVRSIIIVLAFKLFDYMIRGGIEWLFHTSFLRHASASLSDTNTITSRLTRLMVINIWGLAVLPGLLVVWGLYDNLQDAIKGLLALGFTWAGLHISVGSVFVTLAIIYGSFLVSWVVQNVSMDVMLRTRQINIGAQYSIKRLIHYVIIVIGFLMALGILGFEATKITILLSALGVGIGFGLQDIINNFVSGLILLFERPVRVGDTIQLGQHWAEIRRIGLRSTTVKTLDEADVIIPNSNLISNQVTNWTLTNRLVRSTIPVGVAYGSDVALVIETLAGCAKNCEKVATYPAAQVLFVGFGDSTLDFELRIWIKDADYRLPAMSELHQAIDRTFRENQIEIAFPQRDLHLRSIDKSAIIQTLHANIEDNRENLENDN